MNGRRRRQWQAAAPMTIASTGLRHASLGEGRKGAVRKAHAKFFSAISCGTQRSLRCTGHPPAALASLGRHACSVSPLTAITARSGINRAVDRVARRLAPHRTGAAEAGTTFVGARPHEQRWRREKLGRCVGKARTSRADRVVPPIRQLDGLPERSTGR